MKQGNLCNAKGQALAKKGGGRAPLRVSTYKEGGRVSKRWAFCRISPITLPGGREVGEKEKKRKSGGGGKTGVKLFWNTGGRVTGFKNIGGKEGRKEEKGGVRKCTLPYLPNWVGRTVVRVGGFVGDQGGSGSKGR